jgi:DNA-binding IclR family transcriptional regulator
MTKHGAMRGRGRPRHRMIDLVAALLQEAARSPDGLTLTEMAARSEAPLSTVQTLVNGLVVAGYLDERARRYTLGAAPYLLNLMAGRYMPGKVTHEHLKAIHGETGLTTVLSIAVANDLFYVDHVSNDPKYGYLAENRVRRSLIRASSGWVLLAGMEQRSLWTYLRNLPQGEEQYVDLFLDHLQELQKTGICASPHVSDIGEGVSMAVKENGRTRAAIGVIGTRHDISARCDELVETLLRHQPSFSLDAPSE